MTRRTLTVLQDDLDGAAADETVAFALDGVTYEIDLSARNAAKLRAALERYVVAGRRVTGRRAGTRPGRAATAAPARVDREQLAAIRRWARARGMQVSDRGRIPRQVVEEYNAGG